MAMASLSTCHLELVVWDGNLVKSSVAQMLDIHPHRTHNYAKMQMGFLLGGCVASACSRMRDTVLDDFGSMRTLVLETSEKATDLHKFTETLRKCPNIQTLT